MRQKIKYVFIVFFSIILAMIFHIIAQNYSTTPKVANWSFLVNKIGLVPTIILWYVIAYGSISYIFYRYENKFTGLKSIKGLRYGIAIGILWLCGMLEGVSLYGNPVINEFVTGLCDAVPIVLMGLLLGIFTTKNNYVENKKESANLGNIFVHIFVFSIIFLIGRYFFYFTNIIKSGYQTSKYFTFCWTLLMGTCIGITYILLRKSTKSTSQIISSLKFGIIIFGANWLVFIAFMPFIFKGLLSACIIRVIVDTLLVIFSYYVLEVLGKLIVKDK
jgi:hypothetical protein